MAPKRFFWEPLAKKGNGRPYQRFPTSLLSLLYFAFLWVTHLSRENLTWGWNPATVPKNKVKVNLNARGVTLVLQPASQPQQLFSPSYRGCTPFGYFFINSELTQMVLQSRSHPTSHPPPQVPALRKQLLGLAGLKNIVKTSNPMDLTFLLASQQQFCVIYECRALYTELVFKIAATFSLLSL
jgi:hypothetical protein